MELILTNHARDRMRQRNINRSQVVKALTTGRVRSGNGNKHVAYDGEHSIVFIIDGRKVVVITLYPGLENSHK